MAKKKPAKKKATKALKKRPAVRPKAASKAAANPARRSGGPRQSWLDEHAQTPVIDRYARQLTSFIEAMADGQIEAAELKSQEGRLVRLMKEIEPQLNAGLHEKVTQLLCELTAYDIMQMLHAMQEQRPQTVFRG